VVTASRDYICVRPQTYEDKAEAELLLSLYRGRDGVLENTVFCVLGPDGKQRLTKAGRSPMQQFTDADAFAAFLGKAFAPYAEEAKAVQTLPVHDDLALALNVGACDLMPVAVLTAEDAKAMAKLEERVALMAWSDAHVGRQHYVRVVGYEALAAAKAEHGLALQPGLTLVEPDAFGRTAKVLLHLDGLEKRKARTSALKAASAALVEARGDHSPAAKSRRAHLREARRQGIEWESELPVSDPNTPERKSGE